MPATAPTPTPQSAIPRAQAGHAPPCAAVTPLGVVLAFTFLNSIGGGVVTTGFSFLAESAYGFSAASNYWLGLAQGVTYIIGALAVGPVVSALTQRSARLTPRLLLVGLLLALAALCVVPWAMRGPGGGPAGPSWPFWILVTGYSALTGVLWPITESYMSGGRAGPRLRSAAGLFNVTWSSALVVAYWAMGPLLKGHALEVIVGVGAVHLTAIALLPSFTPAPAAHVHEVRAPVPEVYPRLLGVFRMQLPTSYLVYSAFTPFLPLACAALAIPKHWWTPLASVWLASRVLTFWLLQAWHGWHGRWVTAWVGSLLLLGGFGVAVLSTTLAGPWGFGRAPGIMALVLGLALFGIGMGTIYTSALYYAMAVGHAEVDAGGKHEALIGVGYGAGPIFGLAAIAAANAGWLDSGPLQRLTGGQFQVLMLILVATAATAIVALSLWRALHHAGRPPLPTPPHP